MNDKIKRRAILAFIMLLTVMLFSSGNVNEIAVAEALENETKSTAKISLFGDIVIHDRMNELAKTEDGYDFSAFFDGTREAIANSDYAICTMETTFPNVTEFTGFPMFKTSGDLATNLKSLGFDLVNTANNHSVDGFEDGIYRTLDILDENGLDHVGTYRSQEERDKNNGILVKNINGISIAFMSYTYGTNGMDTDSFPYAVNLMFHDYKSIPPTSINYDLLRADLAKARELNTDFIAVQLHWGYEYMLEPIAYQNEIANFMFEQGVDLILGGHPHVPQPMELREVTDLNGETKTGFIVYSMGNLLANMDGEFEILTACLDITLEKDNLTNEAYIKHISYKPMVFVDLNAFGIYDADWEIKTCDTRQMMEDYNNGMYDFMTEDVYKSLEQSIVNLHQVFDPKFDEINGGVDVKTWNLTEF